MFDYKFLGSRIRAMRLERKITQEEPPRLQASVSRI